MCKRRDKGFFWLHDIYKLWVGLNMSQCRPMKSVKDVQIGSSICGPRLDLTEGRGSRVTGACED